MGCLKKISKSLGKCWDNYTWFSMVAMHGEEGDRRYKIYKNSKKQNDYIIQCFQNYNIYVFSNYIFYIGFQYN